MKEPMRAHAGHRRPREEVQSGGGPKEGEERIADQEAAQGRLVQRRQRRGDDGAEQQPRGAVGRKQPHRVAPHVALARGGVVESKVVALGRVGDAGYR